MKITTGKIEKAQKVVLYGVEGIGKSTFASEFPDPLFIDTEGSTAHLDVKRFDRPDSWTKLLDMVRHVLFNPRICKTLVIDTVDWAEALCRTEVIQKQGWESIESLGYGKGYTIVAEEFVRLLHGLQQVVDSGIHVVIAAHAKISKFEQPDELGAYDRWELKLSRQAAPLIKEWADMVLFANYETLVVNVEDQGQKKHKVRGSGVRVMYTTHHPAWDAKNRHGLDEKLPFLYASIADVIPDVTAAPPEAEKKAPTPETSVDPPMDTSWTEDFPEEANPSNRAHEIKKENPKTKWADAFKQAEKEQPQTIQEAMKKDKPEDEVPEKLKELLLKHTVTVEEVKKAVAIRGYYPEDAPIKSYAPEFIDSVLIQAWPQVHELIKQGRK